MLDLLLWCGFVHSCEIRPDKMAVIIAVTKH
jgi:hypothetical protein